MTKDDQPGGLPFRRTGRGTVSTRRLEAFTDGVFAIAATLLVLDLTVNDIGRVATSEDLWASLSAMGSSFLSFVVSFLLLCLLWSVHVSQFEHIVRVDGVLTTLNTLRLLGIVLIPFTTTLNADFSDVTLGRIVLPINFLFVVVIGYLQWLWASRQGSGLLDDMPEGERKLSRAGSLSAVVLGVIALALAPLLGSLAFLAYALDAPMTRLLQRLGR
ncbi:DUF1211 domain-containing protein [Plantibacter flavus]|uniref:TMEM175 family protein n=1 Tax=Plantibacter flavus TaxID=150123 RepID=UPI003F1876EC